MFENTLNQRLEWQWTIWARLIISNVGLMISSFLLFLDGNFGLILGQINTRGTYRQWLSEHTRSDQSLDPWDFTWQVTDGKSQTSAGFSNYTQVSPPKPEWTTSLLPSLQTLIINRYVIIIEGDCGGLWETGRIKCLLYIMSYILHSEQSWTDKIKCLHLPW
jgi:hypothetical protein